MKRKPCPPYADERPAMTLRYGSPIKCESTPGHAGLHHCGALHWDQEGRRRLPPSEPPSPLLRPCSRCHLIECEEGRTKCVYCLCGDDVAPERKECPGCLEISARRVADHRARKRIGATRTIARRAPVPAYTPAEERKAA